MHETLGWRHFRVTQQRKVPAPAPSGAATTSVGGSSGRGGSGGSGGATVFLLMTASCDEKAKLWCAPSRAQMLYKFRSVPALYNLMTHARQTFACMTYILGYGPHCLFNQYPRDTSYPHFFHTFLAQGQLSCAQGPGDVGGGVAAAAGDER